MTDILERLRHAPVADCTHDALMEEAAEEIYRLRSILTELRAFVGEGSFSRQEVVDYVDLALVAWVLEEHGKE